MVGTVPAVGQAYVAAGPQLAVLGYGMNVYAYDAATGTPMWAATLTGFPAGAAIVSVRSWPGVGTVGVAFAEASGKTVRDEVVLATKFCLPMGDDPNRSGGSRRWIIQAVEDFNAGRF